MNTQLITEIKDYLKADEDDAVIRTIVAAAVEKCEGETGKKYESQPLYSQALKMIVADWYDNRGNISSNYKELPFSIHAQNVLNHIAISTDYKEIL